MKHAYPTQGQLYLRGQTWWYRFSFDGKQYRASTGQTVKHKAQKVLDMERERYIRFIEPPDPRSTTIKNVLNLAEEHYAENVSANSEETNGYRLKNLRAYLPLSLPAMMLDSRVVKDYVATRRKLKPEVTNHALNNELVVLKLGLKLALKDRLIPSIPVIDRLKAEGPRTDWFTEQEMFRLLEHLPDFLMNLVEFAFYSGCRRNELFHMEWNWLNVQDENEWRLDIPAWVTKTKQARSLYLVDVLLPPIEQQVGKHPKWIFPHPESMTDGRIKKIDYWWNRAMVKINKKGYRLHGMRKSAARYWRIERGLQETDVMLITGHRDRSVFDQFYNLTEAKDLLKAIERSGRPKLSHGDVVPFKKVNKIK